MVDYSSWRIREDISVTDVMLDRLNPRMPENSSLLTQEDILHLMVDDYKIVELAQSIVKNGFMPLDLMVLVFEDGFPIVLEGNRRIAALKILVNPALAQLRVRAKFEAMSGLIDSSLLLKQEVFFGLDNMSTYQQSN